MACNSAVPTAALKGQDIFSLANGINSCKKINIIGGVAQMVRA
ncbi:hypothetical protein [Rubrolithibacter danxiaensis]